MNRRSFLKLLGSAVALLKFNPGALVEAVSPRKAIKPRLFWAPPGYESAAREIIESEWGKHTHEITALPDEHLTIESDSLAQERTGVGIDGNFDCCMISDDAGWDALWLKEEESPGLYRYSMEIMWIIRSSKTCWSAKLVNGKGQAQATLTQLHTETQGAIYCLSNDADLQLEVVEY